GSTAPPPASTGGLIVQTGRPDDAQIDPGKPLRCFVNGQFIGMETLGDCAQKNGVATQAMDVGIDQTGALAAGGGTDGTPLTPLPPSSGEIPEDSAAAAAAPVAPAPVARGPSGDCLRYAGGWRKVGAGLSLSACVQA